MSTLNSAVLLGRAVVYGLAAGGEEGACIAIRIIKDEIDHTMALLGCATVAQLNREYLRSANSHEPL